MLFLHLLFLLFLCLRNTDRVVVTKEFLKWFHTFVHKHTTICGMLENITYERNWQVVIICPFLPMLHGATLLHLSLHFVCIGVTACKVMCPFAFNITSFLVLFVNRIEISHKVVLTLLSEFAQTV